MSLKYRTKSFIKAKDKKKNNKNTLFSNRNQNSSSRQLNKFQCKQFKRRIAVKLTSNNFQRENDINNKRMMTKNKKKNIHTRNLFAIYQSVKWLKCNRIEWKYDKRWMKQRSCIKVKWEGETKQNKTKTTNKINENQWEKVRQHNKMGKQSNTSHEYSTMIPGTKWCARSAKWKKKSTTTTINRHFIVPECNAHWSFLFTCISNGQSSWRCVSTKWMLA